MKILFQGDSLTDCGRARDIDQPNKRLGDGYVNMICGELVGGDPEGGYEIYNRAVSGNRIADMYARWIEDALNPEYDLLSILCGVNDVGFSLRLNRGSDAERFEFIYDRMLGEVRDTHPKARIMLIEPFLFRFPYQDGPRGDDINRDWEIWSGELRRRVAWRRSTARCSCPCSIISRRSQRALAPRPTAWTASISRPRAITSSPDAGSRPRASTR